MQWHKWTAQTLSQFPQMFAIHFTCSCLPSCYSRLDAMKGFLARAAPPVEVEKRCFGDGNHISVQWLSIARPCGPADAIHPSIARDRSTLVAMSRAYHHCPYIRYHLSLVGQCNVCVCVCLRSSTESPLVVRAPALHRLILFKYQFN